MIRSVIRRALQVVLGVRSVRAVALALLYASLLALSIVLAFGLRFDFHIPEHIHSGLWRVCAMVVGIHLLCMFASHQFDGLLSYFSTPDLKRLIIACTSAVAVLGILRLGLGIELAPPRGVLLIYYFLSVASLCGARMTFRHVRRMTLAGTGRKRSKARRVGIIGAGDCGAALAKDLLAKPWLALQPIVFFDDFRDNSCSIHGLRLVGRPDRISEFKEKLHLDEIIIAMPSAPAKRIRDLLKLIHDAGLPCRTVPSMDQLATGRLSVTNLRPVELHDLLGRAPVEISSDSVREVIQGRTVMVTGAGGSIGSELCRQICSFGPSALVLVERSEPQLFVIEQELRQKFRSISLLPVVGDVTRPGRMMEIFRRFRPRVVFHAAAHKHVPMMELQPEEAIRNNVLGTALIADLAIAFEVERFVFVSTDKAVNPTNVMGATKRLAEMYVQSLVTRSSGTKFMAVRFGNVLGSSGSVVPTFERQIAMGGPVTVTHPEVTRFLMTIPEAVSLVLQSSTFGTGGDIFVLDMGKPVRILDLALQLITLSGLTAHEDIEIVFTGLRPGEKLYEELSHGGETVTPTAHPKIARMVSPPLHHTFTRAFLAELSGALDGDAHDADYFKRLLAEMLPEYTPSLPIPELLLEVPLQTDPVAPFSEGIRYRHGAGKADVGLLSTPRSDLRGSESEDDTQIKDENELGAPAMVADWRSQQDGVLESVPRSDGKGDPAAPSRGEHAGHQEEAAEQGERQ
jgi:FlaA1/EpsC-like NDP-sugar epimerase